MRWKLLAGNVAAVLVIGLLAWVIVRAQVADALARDVDNQVERSVFLFGAMRTAEGNEFTRIVSEGTEDPGLQQVFAGQTETDLRGAAFTFVQRYAQEIGRGYPTRNPRAADIVAITDAQGRVLARNVDARQDQGRDLRTEYEVVEHALRGAGHVGRDFLKYDQQKWYDVVVAPINVGGTLRGLLLVGYEIADSIALEDRRRLGADVGYLIRDGGQFTLHSLSFGTQTEKNALQRWANSAEANLAALFASDAPLAVRDVTIGDSVYRVSASAMPTVHRRTRQGESRPGYIVLQNITAARAPATPATTTILWLTLVGILLVVAYNLAVGNYLERPIEQIEESLQRVINGDRDHRIDLQHAELGGIVFGINQAISVLTGSEEEADESGRISHKSSPAAPPAPSPAAAQGPVIDASSIASFDPTNNAADAQLAQQLGDEPENDYYERLRREYLAARRRAGLGDDGMSHEQFVESVRASEQMLAQEHAQTLVRFQVQLQGTQVVFRAIPIR